MTRPNKIGHVEQLCRHSAGIYRKFIKKRKIRLERRKGKQHPEQPASYGKYNGYD